MTIDNIINEIIVKAESADKFIELLRGNADNVDYNLKVAYTLPVSKRLTREDKEIYISELKLMRQDAHQYLKLALDYYDQGNRKRKSLGGRHYAQPKE